MDIVNEIGEVQLEIPGQNHQEVISSSHPTFPPVKKLEILHEKAKFEASSALSFIAFTYGSDDSDSESESESKSKESVNSSDNSQAPNGLTDENFQVKDVTEDRNGPNPSINDKMVVDESANLKQNGADEVKIDGESEKQEMIIQNGLINSILNEQKCDKTVENCEIRIESQITDNLVGDESSGSKEDSNSNEGSQMVIENENSSMTNCEMRIENPTTDNLVNEISETKEDSNPSEVSQMVIENKNSLMSNSLDHQSSPERVLNFSENVNYRVDVREETSSEDSESSSDDESESDSSLSSSSSDEENTAENSDQPNKRVQKQKTAKGEFDDLPPIENLEITVDEVRLDPLGKVAWTVEQMVVVKPSTLKPTLNIDTILFVERGKRALGRVFDVFGPVNDPHYCVRFNNAKHIEERNIKVGIQVYYCPNSEHTSLVFLTDLLRMRACEDVGEEEHPEFSDDEEERRYFAVLKKEKLAKENRSAAEHPEVPKKRMKKNEKQGWQGKHPWNNNSRYQYSHFYSNPWYNYNDYQFGANYNYDQSYLYQTNNNNWNGSTFPPTQGQPWQNFFPPTSSITTSPPPPPPLSLLPPSTLSQPPSGT